MRLTLRPRVTADEGFLRSLFVSTLPEALVDLADLQLLARERDYGARFPKADDRIVLRDGQAVGRLLVDRSRDRWCLVDVAVLPECRGLGIGSALLADLQADAMRQGRPLVLTVTVSNPARRLYARSGFVIVQDDGVHAVMEWSPATQEKTAS